MLIDQVKGAIFWTAYFSPSIVGFVRKVDKRWQLLGFNAFLGWTIVGWFFSWTYVSRRAEAAFARFVFAIAGRGSGGGGGGAGPVNQTAPGSPGAQQRVCPNGADGRMTCPQCMGRGTWYEGSDLKRCTYCIGSGKVQCTTCSGTGQVW